MKKLLFVLIAVFALAACGQTKPVEPGEETKTLNVLTSPDYPPYEFIDENGELAGFEIELMGLVAEKMGVEINWNQIDFNGILASLESGQGDLGISGFNASAERKLTNDFSINYFFGEALYSAVVLESSGIQSIEDFEGKVIGVQTGTVQEAALIPLAETYGFTLDSRQSFTTIVQDIIVGRIDALVINEDNAVTYIELNPVLTQFDLSQSATELIDDEAGVAMVFPKGSPLVEEVNIALQALLDDGTVQSLIDKWFATTE